MTLFSAGDMMTPTSPLGDFLNLRSIKMSALRRKVKGLAIALVALSTFCLFAPSAQAVSSTGSRSSVSVIEVEPGSVEYETVFAEYLKQSTAEGQESVELRLRPVSWAWNCGVPFWWGRWYQFCGLRLYPVEW
jgi:hypothetical protein